MATEMSCGASSSYSPRSYDVFLSFHGQDTRRGFTDHLFHSLIQNAILTFRDDEELSKGEDISAELLAAIENSRIAIVVFSPKYASSTWCLRELERIMDCKRNGQIEKVLPVFYQVDPTIIRKQSNNYEKAFKEYEERFKDEKGKEMVLQWRAALTEAANLSGWHVENLYEAVIIKNIVEEVSKILNKTILHVVNHPVGLGYHIDRIAHLQKNGGSDVVRIIGIYGLGGIGKTTIAMAVFNYISESFEGSSFVFNVGELSRKEGFAFLQKQLLYSILNREIKVNNEYEGINIIKYHLSRKRVLIVLDNVEKMEQFNKLVGDHDSLGVGSLIILTTRDKHLLIKLQLEEKYSYKVESMNQDESLQLFRCHAFGQNHPLMEYEQLSNTIVQYARGLPLALVVLGSHLYKASKVQWEKVVKELGKKPNVQIMEILEISYKELDENTQTIFLDISCFFNRNKKNDVIEAIDACELGGEAGIELLMQKSLVEIDEHNQLNMHDLIQEMGREIVRKESPKKCGGRTRLWEYQEALDVLEELTGTDAVEGFQLNLSLYNKEDRSLLLTVEAFSRMPNLRLLMIDSLTKCDNINFKEATKANFKEATKAKCFKRLNYIYWIGFPFNHIPNGFLLQNLVILCMRNSKLKEVWKGSKCLPKLKELDLRGSRNLAGTPDFSNVLNLEKLLLKDCESLVEVHKSVLLCSKLETLDLSDCKRLKSLPVLPSRLCFLVASGCCELERLPNLSNLNELRMLKMRGCKKVTELEGLELLQSLEIIEVEGCINSETMVEKKFCQGSFEDDPMASMKISEIMLDEHAVPQWFIYQNKSKSSRDNNMGLHPQLLTVSLFSSGASCVIVIDHAEPTRPVIALHEGSVVVFETKNYSWKIVVFETKDFPIIIRSLATPTPVFRIPNYYWKSKSALKKFGVQLFANPPHERIYREIFVDMTHNTLPYSYKIIFLDISCFFIGFYRNVLIYILDACGLDGEAGIELLLEKSLLAVDEDDTICMHNRIRDMAREIVHKQSLENPGGRSRLWNYNDACDVAINLTGTDAVEGFCLDLSISDVEEHILLLTIATFSTMPNLRCLPMLKLIFLNNSPYLTCLPDFSMFPNLELLSVTGCTSLIEVHESIHYLQRLLLFDLEGCERLESLPMLPSSLRFLIASMCRALKSFPNLLNMTMLQELNLRGCKLLGEIGGFKALKSIRSVDLKGCFNLQCFIKNKIFQVHSLGFSFFFH